MRQAFLHLQTALHSCKMKEEGVSSTGGKKETC